MAYTYQGDAILGISLTVDTPQPLDTRTVVSATKDLYEVPKGQAYRGMTISNLEDGNIYMLIDENKINKSEGWKSSQSALQIISCTQEEYDKWVANTDTNYNPINPDEQYISQGVYYYIQEEEDGVYYLSSIWGKNIEDQLSKKASNDGLTSLLQTVNKLSENLTNNYTTTETLLVTYVTNQSLLEQLEAERKALEELIANYYTKDETDNTFVKKSDLGGDLEGLEGENFVFVTSKQYADDQAVLREELDKTLKLDGEGSLESITVGQIKSPAVEGKEQLVVDVTSEGLLINNDPLAKKSEVPIIITISKEEYDSRVESGDIDEEAYYYLYNTDEELVYVTNKDLIASYHTIGQYQSWVAQYGYSRQDIDNIIASVQGKGDYVVLSQLENYYTKVQADEIFLTKVQAEEVYATNQEVNQLAENIENNYVTKESLKSGESDDEDFIFVTQKTYSADKDLAAEEFTTEHLISSKISIAEDVELTAEQSRLLHNGEKLALTKELHKVEYLSEEDYLQLVQNKETKEDTYYYTYGQNPADASGYVQLDYIEENYYTKNKLNLILQESDSTTNTLVENTKQELQDNINNLNQQFNTKLQESNTQLQEQIKDIVDNLLVELEARFQKQIDDMLLKSEISGHKLTLHDNDIMIVEGETLHILSASEVSINGTQITVN